ncbi:MAG: lysophospholipase [Micropepsaceae bacterium]
MTRIIPMLLALSLSACVAETLAPGPGPTTPRFVDEGHWQSTDGYTLAYSEWTTEKPKAIIVALHGMNDYGHFIEDAAKYWQQHGIATFAFDQRGFGRTEGNGRWPGDDVMVRDAQVFVALVHARYPGSRTYLLGESMGGAVATLAAARSGEPVADGLILVSPAFWGWSNLDFLKRSALWTAMQVAPGGRLTGRGLNIKPSDNEKMLTALGQDPYVIKSTRVDATYGLVNLMEAAWKAAPLVKLSTLVLFAKGDEVVPSQPIEDAAAAMHGPRRIVCYADGYHLLLRDLNAERTWREVEEFTSASATLTGSIEPPCVN